MRVLVTGGTGFVGTHLVRALSGRGHEVRVLDRDEPGPGLLPTGVEVVRGDVRDAEVCARSLESVDAVAHLAAMVGLGKDLADLPRYVSINDLGTAVLLAAAEQAGVRRLALASSMVVYGEGAYTCATHGDVAPAPRDEGDLKAGRFEPLCPRCGSPLSRQLVAEDAALDPRSVYAATKVAQEHLVATWARECGGTGALMRLHNVYGPRLPRDTPYAGVAAIFRSALLGGEAPRVFEDGQQMRDFVHVADVAAAVAMALEQAPVGRGEVRAYNVGSGEPRPILDLATELAGALGGPHPVVTGEYRLGDVRHITASSRRLRAELSWRPEVTFADGVRELAHDSG